MDDTSIEKPSTIIKVANEKLIPQLIVGFLIVIAGIAVLPTIIGLGSMLIIFYFVNSSIEVVRFYPKYSEVKLASIRPRWQILDSSVISAEVKDKVLFLQINDEEKPRLRKIPLAPFTEDDKKSIVKYYQSQANKNAK
ncbi:hypothetical protein NQT69_16315 [Pseudoalteromonas shioyasakiensis]|uniref:hypothetical protein n=1 Tax=Pseudoalteromonas shioyasakiensis TaxID=1190813 RepID=UPI00211968C1|nr:hypothetical protein [Pseudoalteromonas shioyasakiensis]MCQ8879568.1 hypothetical protein [Pseudoalteromonas shioyasakiensis]